ncbi:sigma-54-dependent transcriptional regulator [Phocaeicola sp.]
MSKILIIEDNPVLSRVLCNWLERKGLQTEQTTSAVQARRMLASTDADVVLSDIRLPDGDGVEILEWMNGQQIRIPFVVMTEYAEVGSAVRAMKLGAKDYLPKPVIPEKLYAILNGLLQQQPQGQKVLFRRESRQIKEVERQAKLIAATDISVLVRGENGTGKEYIAHLVHTLSRRAEQPFVPVDCGTMPKELAASELFGHVKGAFTGATDHKTGLLHEAEGGTLFLDEIGNLSYEVQVLLLRVLQERCYRPVGGRRETSADVRIIAATNENLEQAIREGRFREDLYHRLNEFTIVIPTLAECREDILPLAEFFREQNNGRFGKETTGFDTEACNALQNHRWAGNVRELKNCIQTAVLLAEGNVIGVDELNLQPSEKADTFALRAEDEERRRIMKALEAAAGNKALAAGLLQISRPTLYEKMKKYGIETEK